MCVCTIVPPFVSFLGQDRIPAFLLRQSFFILSGHAPVNESHGDAETESMGKLAKRGEGKDRGHQKEEAGARARETSICQRHAAFSVDPQGRRESRVSICAGAPRTGMSTGLRARSTACRAGNPAEHHRIKDGEHTAEGVGGMMHAEPRRTRTSCSGDRTFHASAGFVGLGL